MNHHARHLMPLLSVILLAACTQKPAADAGKVPVAPTTVATVAVAQSAPSTPPTFAPPAESTIPAGPLGDVIRQGRAI
ncbi:MAG: cytochrome C, partial [Rhodanobacter sp.]